MEIEHLDSTGTPVQTGADNPLPVNPVLDSANLSETLAVNSLTWADPGDNTVNTVKTLDIACPTNVAEKYLLSAHITDDGATHESDFTIGVYSAQTLFVAGTPRTTGYEHICDLIVPKYQTVKGTARSGKAFVLEGLFAGGTGIRLICSNDTALTVQNILDIRVQEAWK